METVLHSKNYMKRTLSTLFYGHPQTAVCCKHTVRKWIYIGHKLPGTFDSRLLIYDINAYKKCLEKLIWTKKKNHVPQRGIEPGQVWSSQNQMKNVKRAANWAIGAVV